MKMMTYTCVCNRLYLLLLRYYIYDAPSSQPNAYRTQQPTLGWSKKAGNFGLS